MKYILTLLASAILGHFIMAQEVVHGEYFIDQDMGYSANTPFSFSQGSDVTFDQLIPTNSLTPGFHYLYIRTLDSNGRWSHTIRHPFEILPENPTPQVVGYEYFIDEDPGIGSANYVAISAGANVTSDVQISAEALSDLSPGFHYFYVRTIDNLGKWSHTNRHPFEVTGFQNDDAVVGLEYWITSDPGVGQATYVDLSDGSNISTNFAIPASELTQGMNLIGMRTINRDGNWSHTNLLEQNVDIVAFTPGEIPTVTETVCQGFYLDSISFIAPPGSISGGETIQWYRQNGINTPLGGTGAWTPITSGNEITVQIDQVLNTTVTFACYVTSSDGSGWAAGYLQYTVLPTPTHGTLSFGNQTLATPANPNAISFSSVPVGSSAFTYQWYYFNGLTSTTPEDCSTTGWVSINGATSASYDPPAGLTQNRTYACMVTPTGDVVCDGPCWANNTRQITVTPVGVEDNVLSEISIYPNPCENFISFSNSDLIAQSIEIYNSLGQLVLKQSLILPNQPIDITELSSGCYQLSFTTYGGQKQMTFIKR